MRAKHGEQLEAVRVLRSWGGGEDDEPFGEVLLRGEDLTVECELPEVARVTYLWLEIVGPRMLYVIGDVDLVGDDSESHVAVRLRALEARISASPTAAGAVLSLSAPDEPSLSP